MDVSNFINLALLVATLIGVFVAFLQAREARIARQDAVNAQGKSEAARDEAVTLARAANTEFKRQADAQELANRLAIDARERYSDPWVLNTVLGSRGDFVLTNQGREHLEHVEVEENPNLKPVTSLSADSLAPQAFLRFVCTSSGTMLRVRWARPGEDFRRTWQYPLS